MTTRSLFQQAFAETGHDTDATPAGWTFATQMSSSDPVAWVTGIWWSPSSITTGPYEWMIYSGHVGESPSLLSGGSLGSYTAGGGWQLFAITPVNVSGINFMVCVKSSDNSDTSYAYATGKWPASNGPLSGPGASGGAFDQPPGDETPTSNSALLFMLDANVTDSAPTTEVSKSVDLQYDVKAIISKSVALQYDVLSSISKSVALEFDVKSRVSKSMSLVYDTRSGEEVSKSFSLQHNVRQRVSKLVALEFDTRARLTKTVVLRHNVRQIIAQGKVTLIKYDVHKRSSRSWSLKYGVLVPIASNKTVGVVYDVKQRVSKSVALQFDVLDVGTTSVSKSVAIKYHTLVTAGEDKVITVTVKPSFAPPQVVTTSF